MQKALNILKRGLDFYYRIASTICIIVIIVIALMVTSEILARLLLNKSIQFVMQFSGYSLLLITCLGAAWVQRQESHITVDFVINKFSNRARTIRGIILHIYGFVLCGFLFYLTGSYFLSAWSTGVVTDYPIIFPRAYIIVFLPIGWFFLCLEFLIQSVDKIKNFRNSDHSNRNVGLMNEASNQAE